MVTLGDREFKLVSTTSDVLDPVLVDGADSLLNVDTAEKQRLSCTIDSRGDGVPVNPGDWGIVGEYTNERRLKSCERRFISVASRSSLGDGRAGRSGTGLAVRFGGALGEPATIECGRGFVLAEFRLGLWKFIAACKLPDVAAADEVARSLLGDLGVCGVET